MLLQKSQQFTEIFRCSSTTQVWDSSTLEVLLLLHQCTRDHLGRSSQQNETIKKVEGEGSVNWGFLCAKSGGEEVSNFRAGTERETRMDLGDLVASAEQLTAEIDGVS